MTAVIVLDGTDSDDGGGDGGRAISLVDEVRMVMVKVVLAVGEIDTVTSSSSSRRYERW